MGGGDSGCGIWLLRVTSNNIPQTEQHLPFGLMLLCLPFGLMLLRLGNVTLHCTAYQITARPLSTVSGLCGHSSFLLRQIFNIAKQ